MDRTHGNAASLQAMRLGLEGSRVMRFALPVTIEPETLVLRAPGDAPAPLLVALHPARLTEFQFALRLRDLTQAPMHIAFPRALHAHEVDLGGALSVGFAWCHYTGDNPAFRESLAMGMTYLDRVQAHLVERLAVRRDAIFVLGAEDAALMATAYSAARAEAIAGTIMISGPILPDLVAELAAGHEPPRFLHIDDCVRWKRRRAPRIRPYGQQRRVEELQHFGFRVDVEAIPGDVDPWIDTAGRVIAWMTRATMRADRAAV